MKKIGNSTTTRVADTERKTQLNFIGIDVGTSAAKVIVIDETGKVLASSSQEYPVHYPHVGWAEQDPEDWWQRVKAGIVDVLSDPLVKTDSVRAIGLTGQMHGLVALDSANRVLLPAILWNDQRTQAECDEITETIGQDKLTECTGNKALTGFTAPKILWVKKNHPKLFKRIAHILLPKDYIRFRLSGDFATDVSDASGTLMFDVKNRKWSSEMSDLLELPVEALPKCYESSEVTGVVSESVKSELGLKGEVLIVAGASDQAAGAVGTGTVEPGTVSVSLGTSGVVFAPQEHYAVDSNNRLHAFCHANGKWHTMGVMLSAASCLKWWIDNVHFGLPNPYYTLLSEADDVPAGSRGLFFLPYLMGERTPHSDPNARGGFIGLTMSHTRAEMTRAILEGVAYGLNDSLQIIRELGIPVDQVRVTGGGAKSRLWRSILADVFGTLINSSRSSEGPAFGAAVLAAVGSGEFSSVYSACRELSETTETNQPNPENVKRYREGHSTFQGLYADLKERFRELV